MSTQYQDIFEFQRQSVFIPNLFEVISFTDQVMKAGKEYTDSEKKMLTTYRDESSKVTNNDEAKKFIKNRISAISIAGMTHDIKRSYMTRKMHVTKYNYADTCSITWLEDKDLTVYKFHQAWARNIYSRYLDEYRNGLEGKQKNMQINIYTRMPKPYYSKNDVPLQRYKYSTQQVLTLKEGAAEEGNDQFGRNGSEYDIETKAALQQIPTEIPDFLFEEDFAEPDLRLWISGLTLQSLPDLEFNFEGDTPIEYTITYQIESYYLENLSEARAEAERKAEEERKSKAAELAKVADTPEKGTEDKADPGKISDTPKVERYNKTPETGPDGVVYPDDGVLYDNYYEKCKNWFNNGTFTVGSSMYNLMITPAVGFVASEKPNASGKPTAASRIALYSGNKANYDSTVDLFKWPPRKK